MAGGRRLYGAQRGAPRRVAHAGFVADNDRDASPALAPYFASPWTIAPTTLTAGAFGIDSNGRLASSDGSAMMPTFGNGPVIGIVADQVLTAADAGALIAIIATTGRTVTLPPPRPGMRFDVTFGVTILSGTAKFVTDSASTFLRGVFVQGTDGTFTQSLNLANGTTIRSWNGNGGSTGGYAGDEIHFAALSTTQWIVWGRGTATGTEATPFATS